MLPRCSVRTVQPHARPQHQFLQCHRQRMHPAHDTALSCLLSRGDALPVETLAPNHPRCWPSNALATATRERGSLGLAATGPACDAQRRADEQASCESRESSSWICRGRLPVLVSSTGTSRSIGLLRMQCDFLMNAGQARQGCQGSARRCRADALPRLAAASRRSARARAAGNARERASGRKGIPKNIGIAKTQAHRHRHPLFIRRDVF